MRKSLQPQQQLRVQATSFCRQQASQIGVPHTLQACLASGCAHVRSELSRTLLPKMVDVNEVSQFDNSVGPIVVVDTRARGNVKTSVSLCVWRRHPGLTLIGVGLA